MRNLKWSDMRWWKGTERSGASRLPEDHQPDEGARLPTDGEGAAEPRPERVIRTVRPDGTDSYARFGVPQHLNYPSTTLARLLDQTADRFGDLTALTYEDQRWTYAELLSYVNRVAGGLAELGVSKGDRVVMTLPNCPEYIGAFFGAQKLGAVVVNAGPLIGHDDLVQLLKMTEPRLLIGLDLQAPTLTRAADPDSSLRWLWVSLRQYQPAWKQVAYQFKLWQAHQQPADAQLHTRFHAMLKTAPARPPSTAPMPDDLAVLQLTGGTTGRLKVAMLNHRSLLANATQVSVSACMHPGQGRVLGLLPMFHVYGLTMCLTSVVYTGASVRPFTRFSAVRMLDAICHDRPTVMCVVPAMADAFCDLLERRDPRPVREALAECIVISGSAPLTAGTAHRFEKLTGVPILQGYGLTEASPVTHCNPPDEPRDGSVGLPLPDTTVKIVDLDEPTREVEPGRPGELLINGPQLFAGYYQDEENTQKMLSTDADGRRWLHTGDVAYTDPDGFCYLVDRRKAMINHAGFKIWPAKVEAVLKKHPAIADVAVTGEADPKHTERVIALVVPAEGAEVDDAELRKLCRDHLARYEIPTRFDRVAELPRSPLGKLLRHRLKVLLHGQGNGEAAVGEPPHPQADPAAEADAPVEPRAEAAPSEPPAQPPAEDASADVPRTEAGSQDEEGR